MRDIQLALDAFALATATTVNDRARCEEPSLAATRMLVRHRRDLQQLTATTTGAQRRLDEIEGYLRSREPTSMYTAEVLEGLRAPVGLANLTEMHDAHAAAVARFPGCAAPLQEHLIQSTLQSIPVAPTTPSCAEKDELARAELERAIKAVSPAAPAHSQSPGIALLQARLAGYQALGTEVEQAQASASSASQAGDHQRAADEYARVFRGLPECGVYHSARGDALSAAINALTQVEGRPAVERAITWIEEVQRTWLVAMGEQARQRADFVIFENRRRALIKALEPGTPSGTPPSPLNGETPTVERAPSKAQTPSTDRPAIPASPLVDATRVHRPLIGMAISAGVTVAFMLTAGVLTGRVRRKGPEYARILDAYEGAGINPYVERDLCDPDTHQGGAGIVAACAHHAAIKRGAIALWSFSAAAAISMAVFTVLTVKAARPAPTRPRAGLTIQPNWTGVMLDARLDF